MFDGATVFTPHALGAWSVAPPPRRHRKNLEGEQVDVICLVGRAEVERVEIQDAALLKLLDDRVELIDREVAVPRDARSATCW